MARGRRRQGITRPAAVVLAAVVSMALATVAWAQPIREEEVFQETEIFEDFCGLLPGSSFDSCIW